MKTLHCGLRPTLLAVSTLLIAPSPHLRAGPEHPDENALAAETQEDGRPDGGRKETAPVKADATARRLLKGFQERHYHLGAAGVTRARFRVKATVRSMVGMEKGTAQYIWTGKKGLLRWEDPEVGGRLAQQGFSSSFFGRFFRRNRWWEMYEGTTLVSKERDDGRTEIIVLAGNPEQVKGNAEPAEKNHQQNPGRVRSLLFDKKGILTEIVSEAESGLGKIQKATTKLRHEVLDGELVTKGWNVETTVPGLGRLTDRTEISYERKAGFLVPVKVCSTARMGDREVGSRVLELTGWEFGKEQSGDNGRPATRKRERKRKGGR